MKVTLFLATVLIAGVFAAPPEFKCTDSDFICSLKEIVHNAKYHITAIGDSLTEVGSAVLDTALEKGKSLLTDAAQAGLGKVLEHLSAEDLLGKREVALFDKIKGHVSTGIDMMTEAKDSIKAAFEKAVQKLTGIMGDMSGLKAIEDDADKKIDGVVDEFNKEGKKGFAQMARALVSKLSDIYQEGMAQIKAKFGKKMEARAILGFDSITDAWNKAKDTISGLGGKLADTFQPHLDTLKESVSDLADQARAHGSKLTQSALDSYNQLKDQLTAQIATLQGHASTLGDHANKAVDDLKKALADITSEILAGN